MHASSGIGDDSPMAHEPLRILHHQHLRFAHRCMDVGTDMDYMHVDEVLISFGVTNILLRLCFFYVFGTCVCEGCKPHVM